LTVFAQDSNSNMVLSPGLAWQWSSSAPAVAAITANGETALVHGVALGESTINVQAEGTNLRYLITVTVRNRAAYTVTDIGTLSGGTEFIPQSINNDGVVVGRYTGTFGLPGGFLWENGRMQSVIPVKGEFKDTASYGYLSAVNSRKQTAGWTVRGSGSQTVQALLPSEFGAGDGLATSINNSGQAVGVVESSSVYDPTLAVVWISGQARRSLPPLNDSLYSRANNINNHQQIAGEPDSGVILESVPGGPPRRRRSFDTHAVLWQNEQIEDICPGYAATVNDLGQVVGGERTGPAGGGTYHAFLWQNGQKTDLGPGEARAINSKSQVVGLNTESALLWQNGQVLDLNTQIPSNSGWILKSATWINDLGQIVGAGIHDGSLRGFVLTPR
jgi:probable HAF family extracellular repeat protein